MRALTPKIAVFSGLCFFSAIFSVNNQAQTSGGILTGQIGGMEVQIRGDSALFKDGGLSQAEDANSLGMLMKKNDINQVEIRPDMVVIHRNHSKEPDTVHFPLFIDPTPVNTGIELIDQSTGLLMLNSQVLKLVSSVIPKASPDLSEAPSVAPQERYNEPEPTPAYKIAFFEDDEDDEKKLYVTTPIPMETPIPSPTSSYAKDESFVDLDFDLNSGKPNTIRVYLKDQNGHSESGYFEQLVRKAPGGQEGNDPDKQETGSSKQTTSENSGDSETHQKEATDTSSVEPTPVAKPTPVVHASSKELRDAAERVEKAFIAFHSILNHTGKDFISTLHKEGYGNQQWVALEKIHGTNYSFWTDGNVVLVARKNGILVEGEELYGHQTVRDRHKDQVLMMHKKFCQEGEILTVTGELYGNEKLQKDITYQGGTRFAAFDIFVNHERIDYPTFKEWVDETKIPRVPEVAIRSSLDAALRLETRFQSSLSDTHLIEGLVMKPLFPASTLRKGPVIIKKKNSKFDLANAREKPAAIEEDDGAAHKEDPPLLSDFKKLITDELLAEAIDFEITKANMPKAKGMLIKAATAKYEEAHGEKASQDANWKSILPKLQGHAQEVISKAKKPQ